MVHNGRGQPNRWGADLSNQVRSPTEARNGVLSGFVEGRVCADYHPIVDEYPVARMLSFQFRLHRLVRHDVLPC